MTINIAAFIAPPVRKLSIHKPSSVSRFYVSPESNIFESHLPAWQPKVPLKVSGHGREINSPCSCSFRSFFCCLCYSCGFDGGCGCGGGRCPLQLPYCTASCHSHHVSMALDACFKHVCAPTPTSPKIQRSRCQVIASVFASAIKTCYYSKLSSTI